MYLSHEGIKEKKNHIITQIDAEKAFDAKSELIHNNNSKLL